MKNYLMLLIATMLLSTQTIFAQKVKREVFTYAYTQLPASPLPADYSTYSASLSIAGTDLRQIGFTEKNLIDKYLKLRAFKKLPSGGHFHIAIMIDPLVKLGAETQKNTVTTKNDDGKEVKRTTYYKDVRCYMPVSIRVEDYQGNVLIERVIGGADSPRVTTFKNGKSNFSSISALNKAWGDGTTTYSKIRKKNIESAMASFSKQVKTQYDLQSKKATHTIKVPSGKKVDGAADFLAHYESVKKAFANSNAEQSITEIAEQVAPALEYWENRKADFSATDKKQKKVHHACLYNIAVVNYCLDRLDKAETTAQECINSIDKWQDEPKALIKTVSNTRNLMEVNKVKTRHLVVNVDAAEGPSEANYDHLAAANSMRSNSSGNTYKGTVTLGDNSVLEGTFEVSSARSTLLDFYKGGDVKFLYETNGELYTMYLDPDDFVRAQFADRTFFAPKSNPDLRGGMIAALSTLNSIGEEVYIGENIQVYRFYNYSEEETSEISHLMIQKKDEKLVSFESGSPRFLLWKKGFAKYFSDCEYLSDQISAGKYRRSDQNIIRAAKEYDQKNCEPK